MQAEANGKFSSPLLIYLGVPQGSIVGPSLFLIYVNDLLDCMNMGQDIMFADDANLFFIGDLYNNLYEKMNEQLQKVDSWLIANRLALNTKQITFNSAKSNLPHPNSKST